MLKHFLCLCALIVLPATEPAAQTDGGASIEMRIPYESLLNEIEEKRNGFAERHRLAESESARKAIVDEASETIFTFISERLFPYWYGTPWDFNGTTETPGRGKIACGFFVTTILRDAGFRLQRIRLAQQPSESIIKKLTTEKNIRRFSNTPIDRFTEAIRQWGRGIYLVGLDIHTGFIVNDGSRSFFVHSSYEGPMVVCKEPAETSPILVASGYRVLGKITGDDDLVAKWILRESI